MTPKKLSLGLAAAGTLALAAAAPAAQAASRTPLPTKLLAGDTVYGLSSLLAGTAHVTTPADTPLTIGVSLQGQDPAGAAAFAQQVNTEGSAIYRQFLTPAEYEARFGPTTASVDAVASWLGDGGITVTRHSETPGYLTATGTVAALGSLLHTSFVTFTGGAVKGVIANTSAPTVPATVLGVAGLNTGAHPTLHTKPQITKPRADAPPFQTSPQDLWDIYDQPAADEGQGQGLALFGEGTDNAANTSDNAGTDVESDLRDFEREYQLPDIPFELRYFAATPGETVAADDGYDEWTLDAQAAQGMAPDASKLVDYFGTTGSDPDVLGAYASWVDDADGPLQGSTSFGPCEDVPASTVITSIPGSSSVTYLGNPNQDMYAAVYQQGAAEGRTLFSASGDTGGPGGCPLVGPALNGVTTDPMEIQYYPGDDPNVVGVGGSVLYFNGRSGSTPASRITEYPWNDSSGGNDLFIAAPPVQSSAVQPVTTAGTTPPAGTPAVTIDPYVTVSDHHGNTSGSGLPARLQPDVAALSGDITGDGYGICEGGTCDQNAGGTSLSSPLWLGMWARIQAVTPANSQGKYVGLGFALPHLYQAALPANYLKDYYDTGSAGETPPSVPTGNPTATSPAEGGFDLQTGWGVPKLAAMITTLTGSTTYVPANPDAVVNPPPALPEAPLAVGLPLTALLGGAFLLRRRRRRAALSR